MTSVDVFSVVNWIFGSDGRAADAPAPGVAPTVKSCMTSVSESYKPAAPRGIENSTQEVFPNNPVANSDPSGSPDPPLPTAPHVPSALFQMKYLGVSVVHVPDVSLSKN